MLLPNDNIKETSKYVEGYCDASLDVAKEQGLEINNDRAFKYGICLEVCAELIEKLRREIKMNESKS